jgi:dTDP-4-amino-4,6-dideoxygalactose transaminase
VLNTASAYCSKRFAHGEDIRFYFERVGFSSKMNELEAAIGIGNLDIYDDILTKRRQNLYYLINALEKNFSSYLYTIKKEDYEEIGPHALPIIIKENAKFTRQQLMDFLEKREIDTRTLFSSMPTQCHGYNYLGHKTGDFPVAEYVGHNGIHIGVHQDINMEHCEYIIGTISSFLMDGPL